MGDYAFSVVRGDNVSQPFKITLDNSRTLDGDETWALTARTNPTTPVLIELTTANGGITVGTVDGSANQPTAVFNDARFSSITRGDDDLPLKYDLQMTKDGNIETMLIDVLTVQMDLTE